MRHADRNPERVSDVSLLTTLHHMVHDAHNQHQAVTCCVTARPVSVVRGRAQSLKIRRRIRDLIPSLHCQAIASERAILMAMKRIVNPDDNSLHCRVGASNPGARSRRPLTIAGRAGHQTTQLGVRHSSRCGNRMYSHHLRCADAALRRRTVPWRLTPDGPTHTTWVRAP